MKPFSVGLLMGSLLSACSPTPAPDAATRAGISKFVKACLPVPASYESVRWGQPEIMRRNTFADDVLASYRERYHYVQDQVCRDSADYALMAASRKDAAISAQDVALVKQRFIASAELRDSWRATVWKTIANRHDTTRVGYQLRHVFRARTAEGQVVLDSVGFIVYDNGNRVCNVQAKHFAIF